MIHSVVAQYLRKRINIPFFIVGLVAFSQGMQLLADLSVQFMYKDTFKVSPARLGFYLGIVSIPWCIKPFWGIMTDTVKIMGCRRKSYIFLFGCISGCGWLLLAFFGLNDVHIAVGLLFIISSSICVCNVVGEAIMVELAAKQSRDDNTHATSNVAIFFGFKAFGGLLSSYLSGILLTYLTKHQIFMINSIFPFTMAFFSLLLEEDSEEIPDISCKKCLKDFWGFFKNPAIYKQTLFPPQIQNLRPIILIFCFMMAPNNGPIMFYFYTQVLHFSPVFLGQLKFMYSLGTIIGILLYKTYLKNIEFKKIFMTTTILYFFCYQSLIILVTRKNVEWGIDDRFFCLGDSIMLQLVGELNILPILVFACKICPKSIEATMYAMLMATINFGNTHFSNYYFSKLGQLIGGQLGNVLLLILGIDQQHFEHLWIFIIITSFFFIAPLPWAGVVKESTVVPQAYKQLPIKDEEEEQQQLKQ